MRLDNIARIFVAAFLALGLAASPALADGKNKGGHRVAAKAGDGSARQIPKKDPLKSWYGKPPKVADGSGAKAGKAGKSDKAVGVKGDGSAAGKAGGGNEGPIYGVERPEPEGGDPYAPEGSGERRSGQGSGGGGGDQ